MRVYARVASIMAPRVRELETYISRSKSKLGQKKKNR
jgi:hypothetical protein